MNLIPGRVTVVSRAGAAPLVPQPGKDEPDLASMSLAVAMIPTEWIHACRWDRPSDRGGPACL